MFMRSHHTPARICLSNIFGRVCRFILVSLIALSAMVSTASNQGFAATSRIKDITSVEGIRDNILIGYGLVVGLNNSGDSLNNSPMTKQSLTAMLERLGVSVRGEAIKTGNIAAVMVTAKLPPFATAGSTIDVQISTLGDATSLMGGTLLVTPLIAADSQVYAVAQGAVMISGFSVSGDAASVTQNIPTSARIPNGAIVEKEIDFDFESMKQLRLSLHNPDFTTARRVAKVINRFARSNVAKAENPTTIVVDKPKKYKKGLVDLMTDIEQLSVTPDQPARIIVDERSGVIVIGQDVRISTVAVAQGSLTVRITEAPQVSQPNALAEVGETTVVPRTNITYTTEDDGKIAVMPAGVTLQELVTSLNALGIGPRDVITIIQAIKAAGAIQADVEVM